MAEYDKTSQDTATDVQSDFNPDDAGKKPKIKFVNKKTVALVLAVLLCFAGYSMHRHRGWKQLYDTGVKYSEQSEYKKAVNWLFAAVEHSPRKNKTYTALENVFDGYADSGTALSQSCAAQTNAEISKLISDLYVLYGYIPFGDKAAVDKITAASKTAVSDDGSCSVFDYDTAGNLVRKSFYTADGEIVQYVLHAYDVNGNQTATAEYNADGEVQSCWVNLYNDSGIHHRTVDFYPSGAVRQIDEYDAKGAKHRTVTYWENGFAQNVICYSQNSYVTESVSFYQDGSVSCITMDYKENDLNRYVTISCNDSGYSDAITGKVTPGNRMEVVFYSRENMVADYHWIFFDTKTYKPQISLYGKQPVWSIADLLEN